jgi:hypothetical protein
MFATIALILIIFLPAAFLPVVLDAFTSSADLDEMGISLKKSDDIFPVKGCEFVGFLPTPNGCDIWETNETLQVC